VVLTGRREDRDGEADGLSHQLAQGCSAILEAVAVVAVADLRPEQVIDICKTRCIMSTVDTQPGSVLLEIAKKTYKDHVIDHVYQLLLSGKLRPGDRLKESLLARQLGISRAPVREAMKELKLNGLVDYRPQVGNSIPVLSPEQVMDSYTTRGVLEGYAVMESRNRFSAREIAKLDNLVDQMEDAAHRRNHKTVVEADGEFHDLLISKSDNSQLLEYADRLSLKLNILFFQHWSTLYTPSEIGRRHRDIVESVKSKEAGVIEHVIRQHWIETGSKITRIRMGL
jgi:DNA-binding GntR family transcriptional regulator